MNVLLDTHAFLWWVISDSQLSNTAKTIIADPANTIYFRCSGLGGLSFPNQNAS